MARAHVPRESAAATRGHRRAARAARAGATGVGGARGGPAAAAAGRRRRSHQSKAAASVTGGLIREPAQPLRPARRNSSARAEGRKLAKRLAILRGAARAFRAHGYAATGMREIAREAELSLGVLYYYFASKTELLYFCQDYSLDCMLEVARHALSGYVPHPGQRLRTIIDAQLRLMLDELDGAAAHLEVDALPPSLRARVVKKRDRYEQAVRRIVADGVRSGAFVPCDPKLVTRAILGALNWTARWYRPDGEQPPAAVASAFADYLVRGLERFGLKE